MRKRVPDYIPENSRQSEFSDNCCEKGVCCSIHRVHECMKCE